MIKRIIILLSFAFFIHINAHPALANPSAFAACGVKGSTALYDLENDKWFKTNEEDFTVRTLPASTFKILHSLIALDVDATTADEIFEWDGEERALPIWNQNTVFSDAFKNSTIWVYEELTERIDMETYKRYLAWSGYEGNGDIEHGQDNNYWVYGQWGISPQDQIDMLVKLYKNELPFSKSSTDIVKGFMRDGNTFSKTGWTQHNGYHIGWWVGYIEQQDKKPLFFATRITKDLEEDLGDFAECRKTITNEIIQDKFSSIQQ